MEQWRFELYAFLMVWATVHYALAATLFPRDLADRIDPERERRVFLVTLLIFVAIDIVEAGLRDDLFSPWYFLPSMASWVVAISIVLVVRQRRIERFVAWYMCLSFLFVALAARRLFQT